MQFSHTNKAFCICISLFAKALWVRRTRICDPRTSLLPYQHLDENMTLKWSLWSRLAVKQTLASSVCKWPSTKTSLTYEIMKSPAGPASESSLVQSKRNVSC